MKKPRIGNLRAYLAGTGATGALVVGALVAFLSVGALVAFDGFPLGGDDASGQVSLAEGPGGQAPEAAAAALAGIPDAVAATPAGGVVLAAVFPGGVGIGPGGPVATGPGGTGPGGGTDGGENPPPPPPPPPPPTGGALSALVDDADETTGSLGLPPLGPATQQLTDGIDRTLNDTLNGVGGAIGQPNLGNNVNDTVRGLTNLGD
ncbi:MAG: hypothetical protein ACR2G3_01835 [Solirubrobacterales bacterium]